VPFFHHAGLVFYVVACYALHRLFCTTDKAINNVCLLQYMGFAAFAAGATIFKQGDTGEHFYIILTGAVDVSVHDDDAEKVNLAPFLSNASLHDHTHNVAAFEADAHSIFIMAICAYRTHIAAFACDQSSVHVHTVASCI